VSKLPSGININNLIRDMRSWSWEAADILIYYSKMLENSKNKINIMENENYNDPVTVADLKVNELIIKRINETYKNVDWEILSEENAKSEKNICDVNADWLWVLDPLDGTKDFLQGTGHYAMHLSLNYKQRPFIGAVLIPEKNELWLSNQKEYWCELRDGSLRKSNMSSNKKLKEMVLVTSKNHSNQILEDLIKKIEFKKRIYMGSIGYKIVSILRGESDIYISLSLPGKSSPKDWDFAAPEALLRSAGGRITNIENKDLIYNKENFKQSGIIIASNNKKMHSKLCIEVREIIKRYDIYPLDS